MRKVLLASVAALAVLAAPVPLLAQASAPAASPQPGLTLSAEQLTQYDSWPADRQTAYSAWPAVYQDYYWTLEPTQQDAYFWLDDQQRLQLSQMSGAQQAEAWGSILSQVPSHQSHSASTSSTNPAQSSAGAARTGTSPTNGGVTNATGSSTANPLQTTASGPNSTTEP